MSQKLKELRECSLTQRQSLKIRPLSPVPGGVVDGGVVAGGPPAGPSLTGGLLSMPVLAAPGPLLGFGNKGVVAPGGGHDGQEAGETGLEHGDEIVEAEGPRGGSAGDTLAEEAENEV